MNEVDAPQQAAAVVLPEYWADEAPPAPVRAIWIPWPIAIFLVPLLWIFPRRMGLHFGRVAWPGVILGHLLWTVYGFGCVWLAFVAPRTGLPGYIAQGSQPAAQQSFWPVTLSEAVRSPAALVATGIVEFCQSSTENFLLLVVGTVLAVAGIAAVGGVLLIPWAAGGEKRWRLFARCAKLTLWSTSSVMVLGLGLQVAALNMREPGSWVGVPDEALFDVAWFVGPLAVAYWLWIWLRSAVRHAGPCEGVDFAPRRPRCEACGYVLTGLTTASNCPECGSDVASSMPERRAMPAFAAARTRRGRFVGYFKTLFSVLLNADFFKHIRLHSGFGPARRFALWSAALTGPAAFGAYWLVQFIVPEPAWVPESFSGQFTQAVLCAWAGFMLLVIAFISLLLLPMLLRADSFRPCATVIFYASAWALPLAASVALIAQVGYWVCHRLHIPPLALASGTAASALLVVQILIARRRVYAGLKQARFTNA